MKKLEIKKTIFISLIIISAFSAATVTYIDCSLSNNHIEEVHEISSLNEVENNKFKFIIGLLSKVNKTINLKRVI